MGYRVLVVEDESELRKQMVRLLTEQQFEAWGVETGEQAVLTVATNRPDIILMDHYLPGQSGVETVQLLKADQALRDVPIIMVTGVDSEDEKILALETGADDYLVKPFSLKELKARITAVLRRARHTSSELERLEVDGLTINLHSYQVHLNGEEMSLTLTEYRIVTELLKHRGKVLSRDVLRKTALGNLNVTDRTIDVHMASLRKKLGTWARSIQTVRGVGYRYG